MKKTLITTAVLSALIFGSISANAAMPEKAQGKDNFMPPQPPPCHSQMRKPLTAEQKTQMEKRRAEMDKRLGITDEQKAQLKAIHEKSKAEIAPKMKELAQVDYELRVIEKRKHDKEVYGIDSLDNVKLSGKSEAQLQAEAKTLRAQIHEIKKANFEASQAVFTDKQKKELQKMKEEHKKEMAKKHGKNHHKRPPMPPKD